MDEPANDPLPLDEDPEIEALLDFEPVPRKNTRGDAWTPALQREFIRALARHGSPGKACDAVGKQRSGIDKVAKSPEAESFRAAWAKAVEIAQERQARKAVADHAATADLKMPFLDHRRRTGEDRWSAPDGREPPPPSDDQKWAMLLQLFNRYAQRLAMERECRREGRIAEADFYLRQATFLEIAMELGGGDVFAMLREAKRGGLGLMQIAETPTSRLLADVRRKVWASEGGPARPGSPEHLLVDHGDAWTEPGALYGKAAPVPEWADPEEWHGLSLAEQKARVAQQREKDKAEYEEWMRWAVEDCGATLATFPGEGDAGGRE